MPYRRPPLRPPETEKNEPNGQLNFDGLFVLEAIARKKEARKKAAEVTLNERFKELHGKDASWDEFTNDMAALRQEYLDADGRRALMRKWLIRGENALPENAHKADQLLDTLDRLKGQSVLFFYGRSIPVVEGVESSKPMWSYELVKCRFSQGGPSLGYQLGRIMVVQPIEDGAVYAKINGKTKKLSPAGVMQNGEEKEFPLNELPIDSRHVKHFDTGDQGQADLLLLQPYSPNGQQP